MLLKFKFLNNKMNSNLNIKNVFNCEKFYLFNIARTFAALCVVFQHYQHFYYIEDLFLDFI